MAAITKRTNPKGETCYQVRVRPKGYPVQTETFKRLTEAAIRDAIPLKGAGQDPEIPA